MGQFHLKVFVGFLCCVENKFLHIYALKMFRESRCLFKALDSMEFDGKVEVLK